MLVQPSALVVNVTLQCPLKCAHCCYSSDMFKAGHMSAADVKLAITQAATIPTIRIVHFIGGDPFLHPDILKESIAHASGLGLGAGITTSAFWAKSAAHASEVLGGLGDVGLTELTISYDDAHAKFLRFKYIVNAVGAAISCGIKLRVAVVIEPASKITADSLRVDLGLENDNTVQIYETSINSTGRATEQESAELRERAQHDQVYRGSCQSVLRNIQVTSEGDIIPCCGVLPHHKSMMVGNLLQDGVSASVKCATSDPLYQWISEEGPVAILGKITENDVHPLRPEQFDGVCTACDRMFSSPELLLRARKQATLRTDAWQQAAQTLVLGAV